MYRLRIRSRNKISLNNTGSEISPLLTTNNMTVEQIRQQVELNKKFNTQQKLNLFNMKDRKLDGSKKNWDNALTIYSTKIQLLEEIIEFIDEGGVSINNFFINNTK